MAVEQMANHHRHSEVGHPGTEGKRPLAIALIVILFIMVAEVIGGLLSDSLALLSDAGHMLVDALALGLSLFATILAERPATLTRTYGYHRAEILAAMANGTTLIVVSFLIFFDAYHRLQSPPQVEASLMLVVASIGLIANLGAMFLLQRASKQSLNIQAAFWHIIGDTVSSVGVIIGGIIIFFTGLYVVDPIIAIFIGIIILWGAVRIVRESGNILLEAVPERINMDEVVKAIESVKGVEDVHDIHIWTITSGIYALSAHLIVTDQVVSRTADIIESVKRELAKRFNVTHATLQLECERCQSCPSGYVCDIRRTHNEE